MADNTAVGWIGLGKMGVPMAGHLLDAGFALTVHNRSAGPEAGLRDAGAEIEASPAELAAKAAVIVSMISDDAALADVTDGENGIFTAAAPGTLYIDMSTVSPDASARVAARATECGIGYLRAPVSGGVALAVTGTITVLASGARADFERAEPVFTAMAKYFDLVLGAARQTETPLPLAAFVRQMWSSMIANGAGDEDFLAYVKTMETLSGMKAKD